MAVRLGHWLLILMLLAQTDSRAQDPDLAQIKERELEEVRDRISSLKQSMDQRAREHDRIAGQLQDAEVALADKRNTLRDLEKQRDYSTRQKESAEARIDEAQGELGRESDQLATQVRAAYMSGGQERLKLLLNQRDPAGFGRTLTWYRYLSDMRGENISRVRGHLSELAELRGQLAREEARLETLANEHAREVEALDKAQQERQQLMASLKTRIAEEGSEIQRLARQEQELARLIAELTSILSDYPITSEAQFSTLKGSLTWPVAGTLIRDFGQPRAGGGVKWNGVVLAAPRGREVRAIYHGRVVFADWLAGMGLLIIVDHGESYLTLYGYNETTLKNVGDWVAPGDVIATVGDSGGQQQTGVYFEIRRGTTPENPRQWVSRQPKGG